MNLRRDKGKEKVDRRKEIKINRCERERRWSKKERDRRKNTREIR